MSERHEWVDAAGRPWDLDSESDNCATCGSTPDSHVPDVDLMMVRHLEAAEQMVFDLCAGRKRWTMTVPVEEDRDSDTVIMAALIDLRELLGIGPRIRPSGSQRQSQALTEGSE